MSSKKENNEILKDYIDKNIIIFVRYGFRKRVEETQSYQGRLIRYDNFGILIERFLRSSDDRVHDFFPWHNIDGIRIYQ